jgi:hypothetical protein
VIIDLVDVFSLSLSDEILGNEFMKGEKGLVVPKLLAKVFEL